MKQTNVKFNFRTTGGEDGQPEWKRPTSELAIPSMELEDVLTIAEKGGKELDLLLEAANSVIYNRIRDLMAAAAEEQGQAVTFDQAWLDAQAAAITWETIANLEPATRGVAGIAKETWLAFEADYVATMQMLHPERQLERIKLAGKYLRTKFSSIKSDKKAINVLMGFLSEWFASSAKASDFADVYAAISTRGNELLNTAASAADSLE